MPQIHRALKPRKPHSRIFNDQTRARHRIHGTFTIAELLVAILASALIAVAAGSLVLSNIEVTSKQDSILRLQENWNRIQFLIDQDLSESVSGCFSGSTLTITRASGDPITYTLTNGTLTRTGPIINAEGALTEATSSETVANHVSRFESADNRTCGSTKVMTYSLGLQEVRNGRTVGQYVSAAQNPGGHARVDPIN